MGGNAHRIVIASLLLGLWPLTASAFHLQEATIADIHHAILAKEITATELVGLYLKRIEAYNGQCVKGDVDAGGFWLGEIMPLRRAGQLRALLTLHIRGKHPQTHAAEHVPHLPRARQIRPPL